VKADFLVLATLALLVYQPALPADSRSVGKATDSKRKPTLVGEAKAPAILASRPAFQDNLAKLHLSPALRSRWKAVRQPLTLVAVFGSWCGDSHRQLPGLLALEVEPNPFIEVRYLGVARDRHLDAAVWPKGCAPQKVERVPTFYLFTLQPGGGQKLVGSVVERPPRKGQTMAETLVELVEAAARAEAHPF
jgi:hypothetical protein